MSVVKYVRTKRPSVTIYNIRFPDPALREVALTALTLLIDVILARLEPGDYPFSTSEPSSVRRLTSPSLSSPEPRVARSSPEQCCEWWTSTTWPGRAPPSLRTSRTDEVPGPTMVEAVRPATSQPRHGWTATNRRWPNWAACLPVWVMQWWAPWSSASPGRGGS